LAETIPATVQRKKRNLLPMNLERRRGDDGPDAQTDLIFGAKGLGLYRRKSRS